LVEQRNFEKKYAYADCLVKFTTEDELRFFLEFRLKIDDFAQDNSRNNPLIQKEVENLENGIDITGVSSYHLSMCVHADQELELLNLPELTRDGSDMSFNYTELERSHDWKVTLLDGHHRREALLNRMKNKKLLDTDFPITIRIKWIKTPENKWELRE
jgi:hypothetical protein